MRTESHDLDHALNSTPERLLARWHETGRALGMSETELDAFAPAFEHPEREAARRA
jgi:hypothetical protein